MSATHISGPFYVGGVQVIDENGNIDAPVTTTDLTTTGNTILGNAVTDTLTVQGASSIKTTSAVGLAVGRLGATTPAFTVDSSTGSQVAGLKVTGAVTGGVVAVVATDSGADASLTINAKGAGTIGIGSVSTGAVTITPATAVTGLLTATAGILSNDDITLGAGDNLVGSATSDILINTDKFTVAGATGNTVIAGTLAGAGATTITIADLTTATPNNRAIIGQISDTTTITSGLITGVRGLATIASASGGFVYGTQGKLAVTGTLSGSIWATGLFGQLDMSAATVNAGQVAAIWGDWGTSCSVETDMTGARGIVMTNTTDAVLNAQDYRYGNATNLMELAGAGGTLNYVTGSNGGGADVYLTISINGVPAKITAKYVS